MGPCEGSWEYTSLVGWQCCRWISMVRWPRCVENEFQQQEVIFNVKHLTRTQSHRRVDTRRSATGVDTSMHICYGSVELDLKCQKRCCVHSHKSGTIATHQHEHSVVSIASRSRSDSWKAQSRSSVIKRLAGHSADHQAHNASPGIAKRGLVAGQAL